MDFQLDSEQRMIQESTRQMVDRKIVPIMKAHDADKPLPKDAMLKIFKLCAEQGLTSARVPEEVGGAGLSALNLGLMHEQLPPAIALALIAHEGTGARLCLSSTPEQQERFLPDIIAANKIACTGNTEPDVGSDPRSIKTRAVEDKDEYVITGRKMWITNASICDLINVTCAMGKDDKGLSKAMRMVVEREHSPFEAREIDMMGLKQGHLGEVLFDGCRVPKHNALGEPGDTSRVLTLTWLANRPIFGLWAVGLAQKALDMALQFAGDRVAFKLPARSGNARRHLDDDHDQPSALLLRAVLHRQRRARQPRLRNGEALCRLQLPARDLAGDGSARRYRAQPRDGHRAALSRCADADRAGRHHADPDFDRRSGNNGSAGLSLIQSS